MNRCRVAAASLRYATRAAEPCRWADFPSCGSLQSTRDVEIGNLENITTGWESEIYAFALEQGHQSKRIHEELVLRLYAGKGAGKKSAHEFQSIERLREVGYRVP